MANTPPNQNPPPNPPTQKGPVTKVPPSFSQAGTVNPAAASGQSQWIPNRTLNQMEAGGVDTDELEQSIGKLNVAIFELAGGAQDVGAVLRASVSVTPQQLAQNAQNAGISTPQTESSGSPNAQSANTTPAQVHSGLSGQGGQPSQRSGQLQPPYSLDPDIPDFPWGSKTSVPLGSPPGKTVPIGPPPAPTNFPWGNSPTVGPQPPAIPPMSPPGGGGGGSGGGGGPAPKQFNALRGIKEDTPFNMQPVDVGTIASAASGNPQDIAKVLIGVVEGIKTGMKDIQQGLGKAVGGAFSSEKAGDVGSSAARGAEQMFHGARGLFGQYNPQLIALEKAAGFTATIFESVEAFRKLNDEVIRSNVQFAEHSAAMTQVEVSMERFKIEMDQTRGARRAAQGLAHAESVQRLERSFAKWEDAWANLKGGLLTIANDHLAAILESTNDFFGFMKDQENAAGGMTAEAIDAYHEMGWINEFGRMPANQDARPATPRTPRV